MTCTTCGIELDRLKFTVNGKVYCNTCRFQASAERKSIDNKTATVKKHAIRDRGDFCERCGSSDNVQAHHIISVIDGGPTTLDNIRLLCWPCHLNEHGKTKR